MREVSLARHYCLPIIWHLIVTQLGCRDGREIEPYHSFLQTANSI